MDDEKAWKVEDQMDQRGSDIGKPLVGGLSGGACKSSNSNNNENIKIDVQPVVGRDGKWGACNSSNTINIDKTKIYIYGTC